MLYNKDFLLKLDKSKNKTIYARITALKFDESPIETIEGRVTGGSINLDGASALRRTCSLTMVAQNFNYTDYYWGLKTKFKLEIGVENLIDPLMPNIIWFKQGIYLITGFNTSQNLNNFTISINGKDKMCLLNGEISGSLESSVDFGSIEEETEDGVWLIRKIPIPEIIKNMIHTYAKEPYHNIIINDLDTYGLELLEYRYDIPMYLYRLQNSSIFNNVIIENRDTKVYLSLDQNGTSFKEEPVLLENVPVSHLDQMVDGMTGSTKPMPVKIDDNIVYLAKIEYGQTAGYRTTDLTYAGDLIANIGESLTSVLDKIRNMLVEFEYFYDVDGRFIFQKKKSFVSTLWSPIGLDEDGRQAVIESLMLSSSSAYTFSGGELVTAFNNNPNLLNMRNDYSIWGERTSASGASIPIHMRYAIDNKPVRYKPIVVKDEELIDYNKKHNTSMKGQDFGDLVYTTDEWDWREIIYIMAKDYYKYNYLDDFELKIIQANPKDYPTGQTGYESYYIDIQGFWRQLYNPELKNKIIDLETRVGPDGNSGELIEELNIKKETLSRLEREISELKEKLNGNEVIKDKELQEIYTQLINKQNELTLIRNEITLLENEQIEKSNALNKCKEEILNYYYEDENLEKRFWNKNVFERPEALNFWFDFLDTEGQLQQFNVKSVGSRSKSINDTSIKSIYFRETPAVIFYKPGEEIKELSGYKYIQIPEANMDSMFSISAQGKSAKDKLDELIYQHGYCTESASISAIPIYYLEPNTRIHIYNEDTKLNGEYIVSKITLPLAYNGTMSITATKVAESLY